MAKYNANEIHSFAQARERLERIAEQVKDKDMPLEQSLDLYEEAIAVGNRCSDLIDDTDFSPEEIAALEADERMEAELQTEEPQADEAEASEPSDQA